MLSVETSPIMLSVVILSDVRLNVVMLNAVMLSVVAPWKALKNIAIFFKKIPLNLNLAFQSCPL